ARSADAGNGRHHVPRGIPRHTALPQRARHRDLRQGSDGRRARSRSAAHLCHGAERPGARGRPEARARDRAHGEAAMSLGRWAARIARSVERRVDTARGRAGAAGARHVVPYRGFGTSSEVFVSGRVLANDPPRPATATDAWWHNLAATLGHLESDEVAGARLRISIANAERHAVTDEEGFYRAWLSPTRALPDSGPWHVVDVEVIEPLHPDARNVVTSGLALVPPPAARFGVISDLDDTVIRTDATRLLTMLRRTFLQNARTRLPFAGVAEFYSGLHQGDDGTEANPVFYVSSSPWNLYPILTEFLEFQSIPLGPLMLRDWGI